MASGDSDDPFELFARWFAEATASEPDNPDAMTLATADAAGRPSARMVLLKAHDRQGFVFYTNLESRKGRELAANPHAALLFHWKSLARQIRIEGPVAPVDDAEADAYFATRPRAARIGARVSRQSRPLEGGRLAFERALAAETARFAGRAIPRPASWSGFRLTPEAFEFWEEGRFRLHRRRRFRRAAAEGWEVDYLYP